MRLIRLLFPSSDFVTRSPNRELRCFVCKKLGSRMNENKETRAACVRRKEKLRVLSIVYPQIVRIGRESRKILPDGPNN